MALHDIQTCSNVFSENLNLKRKLQILLRNKDQLQHQLDDLIHRNHECVGKQNKRTKDAGIQTESKPWMLRSYHLPPKQHAETTVTDTDIAKTSKVLEMHAQLLKRYDKEVKLNMTYADSISDLNVRLAEAEQQLRGEKEKSLQLERELIAARGRNSHKARSGGDDTLLREVVEERNRLAKVIARLKGELKGLDQNFFDEIEDLKFALLQSNKLNKAYEKSLRKLCLEFNTPYPAPEKILGKNLKIS